MVYPACSKQSRPTVEPNEATGRAGHEYWRGRAVTQSLSQKIMRRRISAATICFLLTLGAVPVSSEAQQPKKPGRPGGTAGLAYVVVDLQVPARMSSENAALGRMMADAFASALKENGAAKVVRKAVLFSKSDLRDAKRMRTLRQELGVDIVVGGELAESGENLTVSSVRAQDAVVLATAKLKVGPEGAGKTGELWKITPGKSIQTFIRDTEQKYAVVGGFPR